MMRSLIDVALDWYYGPNRRSVRIDEMGGDEILIVTTDGAYSIPNTPENRDIANGLRVIARESLPGDQVFNDDRKLLRLAANVLDAPKRSKRKPKTRTP